MHELWFKKEKSQKFLKTGIPLDLVSRQESDPDSWHKHWNISKCVVPVCLCGLGHHELPPVAHTTMLRDFPGSRSGEAFILPRPSTAPVTPASYYHQHYVSHSSSVSLLHLRGSKSQDNDALLSGYYYPL